MSHHSIRDILATLTAYACAKDVDGILALYHPSALAFDFGQHGSVIGLDQIREDCANGYRGVDDGFEYSLQAERIVERETIGYCFGVERVTGTRNGVPFRAEALASYVFEKIDGRWLITHQHLSMPQPPR